MADFYDWHRTLTYDADVTMVIGARGIGKTYGLRKQCIKDYLKHGWRFGEICRYKKELSQVADGYFSRLSEDPDFDEWMFKTDTRYMYISENVEGVKDEKGKPVKPTWRKMGYFFALTDGQQMKKRTFHNVKRVIFDEGILERSDRYHRYLPNEFMALANAIDTMSRERADVDGITPRLYILGNACDIANPYFQRYKVGTDLQFGYRWYDRKRMLLHYVRDDEYSQEKMAGTVAGRMMGGDYGGTVASLNQFEMMDDSFVKRKPPRAKFSFGIICNGKRYGIWNDYTDGWVHVTESIPNGMDGRTYTLTASDSRVNYMMATRLDKVMQSFMRMYWAGIVCYEDLQTKMDFQEILTMFGVR